MTLTAEIKQQLAQLQPQEIVRLYNSVQQEMLSQAEAAKVHPLTAFALPAADWQKLKSHLMDGGGVNQDADLGRAVLQALMDDDQVSFWPAMIHLLKAWLKIRGHVQPLPGGGTKFNGVGPTNRG